MGLWLIFLESFGIAALADGHVGGGVFLVAVWWPFLVPYLLALRDQVRIEDDSLIARGWFREQRWTRGEIRSITVVHPSWAPNFAYLSLDTGDDRSFRLPGTTGSPWLWDARRRDRQLNTLLEWLGHKERPST
jgi:hypothetical protein